MITVEQRNLNTQATFKSLMKGLIRDGFVVAVKKKLSILEKYSNIALGKCFLSFRMNSEK